MTTDFTSAAIAASAAARDNVLFGARRIRVRAADTGGRLGFFEEIVAPGAGVGLHVHHREDEMFNVRMGRFRIQCGDETFEMEPGDVIVLPRGVPHAFRNVGETEGLLDVTVTPGGFETLFLLAEAGEDPEARFMALAPAHGLEMLPDGVAA